MSRALVSGSARGEVLKLDEPVSFWGGVDPTTGLIIEPGHPQFGQCVAGRIVVMRQGRGSSSASSVLAELLRIGLGPSGFVLSEPDSILVIGALVANRLYSSECPVIVVDDLDELGTFTIDEGKIAPFSEN